jgi:hypothetical protein
MKPNTSKLLSFGKLVLGFAIAVAIFVVLYLAFFTVANLHGKFSQWISLGFTLLVIFQICMCPLAVVGRTRRVAGVCLLNSSILLGLLIWMRGIFVAYVLWGLTAVIIGLLFAGVGVVPVAMLACALKSQWGLVAEFAVLIGILIGSRMLGYWCLRSAEEIEILRDIKSRAERE